VLERIGLAMAGASCGLFVSAHVGSSIGALTSQGFLLGMMIVGAIAFYLGIDTPQLAFHSEDDDASVDAAEFLSSVGTFLATLTAFASVGIIILREEPNIAWTWLIMAGSAFRCRSSPARRRGCGIKPSRSFSRSSYQSSFRRSTANDCRRASC
jgi:hypothetical protein